MKTKEVSAATTRTCDGADPKNDNDQIFDEVVNAPRGFTLLVEHDVMVHDGVANPKRKHEGKRRELFQHRKHLSEVAVRVIAAFGRFPRERDGKLPIEVLATNKNSVAVVY